MAKRSSESKGRSKTNGNKKAGRSQHVDDTGSHCVPAGQQLLPHANSAPLRQQRPPLQNSPALQHVPEQTVPVQHWPLMHWTPGWQTVLPHCVLPEVTHWPLMQPVGCAIAFGCVKK